MNESNAVGKVDSFWTRLRRAQRTLQKTNPNTSKTFTTHEVAAKFGFAYGEKGGSNLSRSLQLLPALSTKVVDTLDTTHYSWFTHQMLTTLTKYVDQFQAWLLDAWATYPGTHPPT